MISELNFKADFKVNHKNLPDRIQFLILQKNFILFLLKIHPEKKKITERFSSKALFIVNVSA